LDLILENLFFYQEDLYYRLGNDIAKFNPHALLKISKYIVYDGKAYRICIASNSHVILETPLPQSHTQQKAYGGITPSADAT
jgi:hypothetical protein